MLKFLGYIYYTIGRKYYVEKKFRDAENYLLKAVELFPSNEKFVLKYGMSLFKQEKWKESVIWIEKALELKPNKKWEVQLNQAKRHIAKNTNSLMSLSDENEILRELKENNKVNNTPLTMRLISILSKKNKWEELDKTMESLDLNNIKDKKNLLELAELFMKRKQYIKAINIYKKILNLKDKGDNDFYLKYGITLEKTNNYYESNKLYKKLIISDNNYNSKELGIGIFFEKKGIWKEALNKYKKQIELKPLSSLVNYKLGLAFDRNYEWKEAQKYINNSLELKDSKLYMFYRLGFNYERDGKLDLAINTYSKAIEKETIKKEQWNYRLGYVLYKQRNYKKACEAFSNFYLFDFNQLLAESINKVDEVELKNSIVQEISKKKVLDIKKVLEKHGYVIDKSISNYILLCEKNFHWQKAEEIYKSILNDDNDIKIIADEYISVDEWIEIATIAKEQRLWKEAIEAYKSIILKLDHVDKKWYFLLAYCYYMNNNIKKSIDIYILAFSKSELMDELCKVAYEYSLRLIVEDKNYNETAKLFTEIYKHMYDFQDENENNILDSIKYIKSITIQNYLKETVERINTVSELEEFIDSIKYYKLNCIDAILEKAYKKILMRKNEFDSKIYIALGTLLYRQERHKEASEFFKDQKILQKPYAINEKTYNSKKSLKKIVDYTEYYDRLAIKDNVVLFESFAGKGLSDNPYAIFKAMLSDKYFSEWKFIWVLENEHTTVQDFKENENIITVRRDSDLYFRYLSTAKVLINNAVFPTYFIKKENQVYISTWHGTPWKTLGNDNPFQNGNTARNFIQADFLLSPNSYTTDVLINKYGIDGYFKGELLESGYPRIDSMINATSSLKSKIKKSLNIFDDKPIVLYAPTYKGFWKNPNIEADKVIKDLESMKGDSHHLIFRGHYFVEDILRSNSLSVEVADHTIDSCELLSIVDILITDYSSILFDFLPMNKPILLYIDDYEMYVKERGLYLSLDEVPGTEVYNSNQLNKNILDALKNPNLYTKDYSMYRDRFSPYEDGKCSIRVIDKLKEKIDTNIKYTSEEKKSVIIYPGSINTINDLDKLKSLIKNIRDVEIYLIFNKTELVKKQDIKNEIYNIKAIKGLFEYCGNVNKTIEEDWIRTKVRKDEIIFNKEQEEIYKKLYIREYRRLFLTKEFTFAILIENDNLEISNILSKININNSFTLSKEGINNNQSFYSDFIEKEDVSKLINEKSTAN